MDVRVGLQRKLSTEELMLLNCGVGEESWESLGQQGDPTSPFWRRSVLGVHWKDWCWSWNSNTLTTWWEELTHWKRPWHWERLKAGGKENNRGWDGWIASRTQWTWVCVNSGSWWWTGKVECYSSWGCKESDMTERLNWTELKWMSDQFSSSVMSDSLWPHGLQHARPPCPSPTPGVCSNSYPLSRWSDLTIPSSVVPFSSHLQSFPSSRCFPMSQFFASGCQSIGISASASVLAMNIQDWFPLGWTSWISLQSKGLSRVFSNTIVQKHQFFGAQLSL